MIPEEGIIPVKKLYAQVGEGEPEEFVTLRIPECATEPDQVGHTVRLVINTDLRGNPFELDLTISPLQPAVTSRGMLKWLAGRNSSR